MAFGRRVGCATLSWTLMSLVAKLNEPECYGNSIFFPYLLWDDDNCLMQQLRSFWVMEKSRIVPNTKPAFQLMAWELLQSWNNEWNWKIVIFKIPYTIHAWWLTTAEWRLQMLKKTFLDRDLFENYKVTMKKCVGRIIQPPTKELHFENK